MNSRAAATYVQYRPLQILLRSLFLKVPAMLNWVASSKNTTTASLFYEVVQSKLQGYYKSHHQPVQKPWKPFYLGVKKSGAGCSWQRNGAQYPVLKTMTGIDKWDKDRHNKIQEYEAPAFTALHQLPKIIFPDKIKTHQWSKQHDYYGPYSPHIVVKLWKGDGYPWPFVIL